MLIHNASFSDFCQEISDWSIAGAKTFFSSGAAWYILFVSKITFKMQICLLVLSGPVAGIALEEILRLISVTHHRRSSTNSLHVTISRGLIFIQLSPPSLPQSFVCLFFF